MNFLRSLDYVADRVVGFVSPERAVRRLAFRGALHEFGYDAANPGRMRGSSGGRGKNAASETLKTAREANDLMWEARDAVRNNPLLAGIVARVGMYVTAHLSYEPNTGDRGVDKIYADFFHDWSSGTTAGETHCDLTGRRTLRKMVAQGFAGQFVDGDFGLAWQPRGPELRLVDVEADRIGSPYERHISRGPDGALEYIRGLHLDEDGRIVMVRVFERTETGMYRNQQDVPKSQFMLMGDPLRADQYRPVSCLQVVLPTARDLQEILTAEKAAAKWAATYAAFLITKTPNTPHSALAWDGKTASGTPTMEAMFAKIVKMTEGEDIKFAPSPTRPSGALLDAVETFLRHMATALDLPFGFLYNLSMLGGVSQRIEVVFAQRKINYWQQHVLAEPVLNPIKNAIIDHGIALGLIPPALRRLPTGELVDSSHDGDWNFGPKITGDVGHQTTADIALVNGGYKAPEDLTREYSGKSYREVVERIAANVTDNRDVAMETNIPVELQAPERLANGSQLLGAMASPPPPPPKPGSQEAVGDKGVQIIADLLSDVFKGDQDPDAAVEILVNTFKIPRAKAEEMVPNPQPLGQRNSTVAAKAKASANGSNGSKPRK